MGIVRIIDQPSPKMGKMDLNRLYHVIYELEMLDGWRRGSLGRDKVVNLIRALHERPIIDRERNEAYNWADVYFKEVRWDAENKVWIVHVVQEWLD